MKNISSHGYVRTGKGDMRSYEHIDIAESALGRRLAYFGAGNPLNEVVHHIDGNKENNSKSNLLVCTHSYHVELHARLERSGEWPQFKLRINHPVGCKRTGKSGFKGVESAKGGKWSAHIRANGRKLSLGVFATAEAAAAAYDNAAALIRGAGWTTNKSMGLLP